MIGLITALFVVLDCAFDRALMKRNITKSWGFIEEYNLSIQDYTFNQKDLSSALRKS